MGRPTPPSAKSSRRPSRSSTKEMSRASCRAIIQLPYVRAPCSTPRPPSHCAHASAHRARSCWKPPTPGPTCWRRGERSDANIEPRMTSTMRARSRPGWWSVTASDVPNRRHSTRSWPRSPAFTSRIYVCAGSKKSKGGTGAKGRSCLSDGPVRAPNRKSDRGARADRFGPAA